MSKETINKTSVILRSMVKTVFKGLKDFLGRVGEPGIEQQAAVGRAMGILRDHRKEQVKEATYSNTLDGHKQELQQLRMQGKIDHTKLQILWDKITDLEVEIREKK